MKSNILLISLLNVFFLVSCSQSSESAKSTDPIVAPSVLNVVAGGYHNCALLVGGIVKCWGRNFYGELGQGDTSFRGDGASEMGDNLPAVDFGSGRTATSIVAGQYHNCALLDNGSVKCWGRNEHGELGLGDTTDRGDGPNEMGDHLEAIDFGSGRSVKSIVAGDFHTCAILDDDSLKCWGYNADGVLGLGDSNHRGDGPDEMGDNLSVVDLGAGQVAKTVKAGFSHTCAILENNNLKCWGYNFYGHLGLGDTESRGDNAGEMGDNLVPLDFGLTDSVSTLSISGFSSCVILEDSSLKCWGENSLGQLGLGDTQGRGDQPNEMGDDLAAVDLGFSRVATSLSLGDFHACAILDNGSLKCWGYNSHGQLGLGDLLDRGDEVSEMGDSLSTVNLGSGRTALSIATGNYHSCAILDNNTVKCWGRNVEGQLGLGDTSNRGDEENEMGDNLAAIELQ